LTIRERNRRGQRPFVTYRVGERTGEAVEKRLAGVASPWKLGSDTAAHFSATKPAAGVGD